MKTILLMLVIIVSSGSVYSDEIIPSKRIQSSFIISGNAFDDYMLVAYPVNTSAGTGNYTFVEIKDGESYKVECDNQTPFIYAIKKSEYDPNEIITIIDQKAGPVIPYYREIKDILTSQYIYITDIDCYPFVDELSEVAKQEFIINVIKAGDGVEIEDYSIKFYDKNGNELDDAYGSFLGNPDTRLKFFASLSLISLVGIATIIVIKKSKR